MKYQIEHLLAKYELTLTDSELAPEFREAANRFFEFTKSPDVKPEQVAQMDKELVDMFNSLHTVINEADDESVEANRMTAKLKGEVEDYKAKVEALTKQNAEIVDQLEAAKREKLEREQREASEKSERERLAAEEHERQNVAANELAEQQKKHTENKSKLDLLVEKEIVGFDELEELGVPNIGTDRIEWNGLVFKKSGMLMSRKYAVYDHRN